MRSLSGEYRREVDVDLPVRDQVAVEDEDVRVRHGDVLAIGADILDVDLGDAGVLDVPGLQDVMGQSADGAEEARHRLADGRAADHRLTVAEPEHDVVGQVRDELVRVESINVGENRVQIPAHRGLLHPRGFPELYAVWGCPAMPYRGVML